MTKTFEPCSSLLSCESRLLSCEYATVRPAVLVLLSTDCLSLPVPVPVPPPPLSAEELKKPPSLQPSTIRSAIPLDPVTSNPCDCDPANLDSSPLFDLKVSDEATLARSSTSDDVDLEPDSTPRPPPRDPQVVDR
ncbi:hypothetical protein CRG98_025426 [Punica granatum]|uniref:Uncharacterized protein n=1 Tax=Punica granatum TaxID=22663 RepID=A0A2I0JDV2_PUNGR|nr:hypothetical protein CRG98_025426 [Punica granatum]